MSPLSFINSDVASTALSVVNHISAIVGYWDMNQRCVFSNEAYREWFGWGPEEMLGRTIKEVLGPLYELNLNYIQAALRGEKQVFERQIQLPKGGVRQSITTYTPDIVDGRVVGFAVHIADVTALRARESALEQVLRERDEALAEVQALKGLLSICAGCKSIQDGQGSWHSIEDYVSQRADVSFSHSMCPKCMKKYYPD